MQAFRQLVSITGISLRTAQARFWPSLVLVVGVASVVVVLTSALAVADELAGTYVRTGRPDRAIILYRGATSEVDSTLTIDQARAIADSPDIAHDGAQVMLSAEALASLSARRSDGVLGNISVRGVTPTGITIRPEIRVVQGRLFRPGVAEVVVGKGVTTLYSQINLGREVTIGNASWRIVGVFDTDGTAHDSEILCDTDALLSAYHRATYNSLTVRVSGEHGTERLATALDHDPRLAVTVMSEEDYYEAQAQTFARFLKIASEMVSLMMAIGAVFGALNAMYSAVRKRSREIATFRALGFSGFAVAGSIVLEAIILALVGAAVGGLVTWWAIHGTVINTIGNELGRSQVVLHLHVGLHLFFLASLWACAIGAVGGLLPAVRAVQSPVTTAFRAG